MNGKPILFLCIIIMLCLIPIGAAETYEASITTYRPDDIDDLDNTTWSPFGTFILLKGETKTSVHEIEVLDISLDSETVFIEVKKGSTRYTRFITVGERIIIDDDFQVGLNFVRSSGGSSIIDSDDNVVTVWVSPNSMDKLILVEGGLNEFNPIEFGKQDGWSSIKSEDYVTVYVHRNVVSAGILIDIEGGDWDEVTKSSDSDRSFELNENGVYAIIITYTERDVWGGERDEEEIYEIQLAGLDTSTSSYSGYDGSSSGSSGSSGSSSADAGLLGSYSNVIHKYIIVVTEHDGQFDVDADCTVKYDGQNSDGNYVWKIKFSTIGIKKIDFHSSEGIGQFEFDISESSSEGETTVSSDQSTSGGTSNSALILVVVGVIAIIGVIAYTGMMKKKDKGGNTPEIKELLP